MVEHRTIKIKLETYRKLKVLCAARGQTIINCIDGFVSDKITDDGENYYVKTLAINYKEK